MKSRRQKTTITPIMAAGGIVTTAGRSPLFAIVQRRKDDDWVLPKGKLKPRETVLAAARRETEEETGHKVIIREFLGTVSYESGGRPKIVHYWRMVSAGRAGRELMNDIKAVKWLPLKAAISRLTQPLEKAFLANVGRQSPKPVVASALAQKSPKALSVAHATPDPSPPFDAWRTKRKTLKSRANIRPDSTAVGDQAQRDPAVRNVAATHFIRRIFMRLQKAATPF
jgi:8-oxo-dGTP diphosphatase